MIKKLNKTKDNNKKLNKDTNKKLNKTKDMYGNMYETTVTNMYKENLIQTVINLVSSNWRIMVSSTVLDLKWVTI